MCVEIGLVAPGPRFGEAHVTQPASHLDQMLARHFRVGLPADAVIGKKTIDDALVDRLPADEVNGWFANDAQIAGWIESSSHAASRLDFCPRRIVTAGPCCRQPASSPFRLRHGARIESGGQLGLADHGGA